MNVVVNEEDFIKLQNIKVKEYDSQRIVHPAKEVRVEARVEKLEDSMINVNSEIKMMNKTMRDIADTLREIKDDQKRIQQFEIQKAMLERDILDQKKLIELVFKKLDTMNEKLNSINIKEAGNDIKIGHSERVVWLIISGAIGALGWFTNAK